MAKKQAAQLTPAEEARLKAEKVVELEAQKKALEAEIGELKDELVAYVEQTGERDLGALLAEKRASKPSLDFGAMTPKQKGFALEQLMLELPDYVSSEPELNVEKLFYALPTSATVQNALKVRGITIVQKETWAWKKAVTA